MVALYRKAQKAHDSMDSERWEEAEVADTVAGHSTTQATALVERIGVRRFTPLEVTRLQGFPDDHLSGSDSVKYRQLGNAVPPQMIEWIARRLPA